MAANLGLGLWLRWFLVLLVAVLIFYKSVTPRPSETTESTNLETSDNSELRGVLTHREKLHLLAYSALSIVFALAVMTIFESLLNKIFVTIIIPTLFGAVIELIQKPMSTRYFSYRDILVNMVGSFAGVGVIVVVELRF
jgi:VanZ family protein